MTDIEMAKVLHVYYKVYSKEPKWKTELDDLQKEDKYIMLQMGMLVNNMILNARLDERKKIKKEIE